MREVATASGAGSAAPSPYPGLRPYERNEQALFFGRDRDAELLANKVLAAPVTLLFGQSGRGKSSLLRALLVPRLEEEGARVFTFDGWAAEDPVAALVERLGEAARGEQGDPESGEPAEPPPTGQRERALSALLRLVRRLSTYDPRPLVLVFDQFEELLLRHGGRIEPIRREIATLLRAEDVECRVLISLREEFLAALEPFRRDIPALFDSTFRLEPLSMAALRDAVAKPAERFGMSVEPALVDLLLKELGTGDTAADGPEGTARASAAEATRQKSRSDEAVELPILQLVLAELWRSARSGGAPALTVEVYGSIGGSAKVRTDYVASVMPTRRRDRLTTARLLRYLAPPSGYKASFSAEDLTEATDLPGPAIARELDRLRAAGILRVRDFRDRRLFELQHDALIGVLTPWREQVLRQDRQRRWVVRSSAAAAVVLFLAGLGAYVKREADLREIRSVQAAIRREQEEVLGRTMAELRAMPAAEREGQIGRIEQGVRLLLQSSDDPARLDHLADVLKANEDLLPLSYGYQLPKELEAAPPPDDWPYVIEFSPGRMLEADDDGLQNDGQRLFRLHWQEYAKFVGKTWGFPVPSQIKLRRNPNLPARRVRLLAGGREMLAIDVERYEDRPALATKELKGVLRDILDRFGGSWPAIAIPPPSSEWRLVSRWSLPIWKAFADPATDGTTATALFVMQALIASPGPVLVDGTPPLLDRVKRTSPVTVAEAIAARGEQAIAADLAEVVKTDRALSDLTMILDALGSFRKDEPSAEVAQELVRDLDGSIPTIPARLGDPPSAAPPTEPPLAATPMRQALEPSLNWISPREQPINVYAGRDILEQAFDSGGAIRPEALEAFEHWRDEMTRRFGVSPPALRFRTPDADWVVVKPDGFRLAFLNQTATNLDTTEFSAPPNENGLATMVGELAFETQGFRQRLITAEMASSIVDRTDPAVATWLRRTYTPTDIKNLLRSVTAPSDEESSALRDRLPGDPLPPSDPDRTVRHAAWLLSALPLLESTLGRETEPLAKALRVLQARKGRPTTDPVSPPTSAALDGLLAGNMEAFQSAVPDREARLALLPSLLSGYAARFPAWRARGVREGCEDPIHPAIDREGRLDVEDLLAAGDQSVQLLADLRLCLFAAVLSAKRTASAGRLSETILGADPEPDRWTPERAGWFGQMLLNGYRRRGEPPARLATATALLRSAADRLDERDALVLVTDVEKLCSTDYPYRWCEDILDDLAEAIPGRFALNRADVLTLRSGEPERVRRGLALLDRYLAWNAQSPTKRDEVETQEIASLIRSIAELTLAEADDDEARLARLTDTWRRLGAGMTNDWRRANARFGLMRTLLARGRDDDVKPLLDLSAFGEQVRTAFESSRLAIALIVALRQRDRGALAEFVQASGPKGDADSSGDDAFVRVMASLLSGDAKRAIHARPFVRGKHPYRDIVAVLYAIFTEEGDREDAKLLLEQRWTAVDPTSWETRWRQGDMSAWYEFLLGRFLGKPQADLSVAAKLAPDGDLADTPFTGLPSTRQGLLCEFLFYDAMKALSEGYVVRARSGLEAVRAQHVRRYFESAMADFLLGEPGFRSATPN